MRHTPCGCRSADLVGVLTNIRLPEHSTMRRAPAMPLFRTQSAARQTSHAPHGSKARLQDVTIRRRFMAKPCTPHLITRKGYATSVRQQSCQRLCNAQRVQRFKIKTANVRGQGVRPLAFLWGFQRGYSLWKENTPFAPRPHGSGTEHRALWASKKRIQLSLYE